MNISCDAFVFTENVKSHHFSFTFFSKANFTLPSTDFGWFDEVIYTELQADEAKKKIEEFNEKGKKGLKEDRGRDRGSGRSNHRRGT